MNANNSDIPIMDRLKAFLPQIAKANAELEEKIRLEGEKSVVIDDALLQAPAENAENEEDTEVNEEKTDVPVVQIEFALGEFDETPLGQMEETMKQENEEEESEGVMEKEEEEEEVKGVNKKFLL